MTLIIAAGSLRKSITIQSRTDTNDSYGGPVHTWATFQTARASVEPLKGRELIAAQAAQSEVTIQFMIRYIAGVLPAMRIVYAGKNYNIISVIDVEDRQRQLQIMAATGLSEG